MSACCIYRMEQFVFASVVDQKDESGDQNVNFVYCYQTIKKSKCMIFCKQGKLAMLLPELGGKMSFMDSPFRRSP